MSDESKARKIHGEAAHARETGDSLKALQLAEEARIEYAIEGDQLGFAEIHGEISLILGHLAEKASSDFFRSAYLIAAKNNALTGVEVSEISNDKTSRAIPYTRLGKTYEDLNELENAVDSYTQALNYMKQYPPERHHRSGVVADIEIRLYSAKYKLGDKTTLDKIKSSLKDLEESDEPQYNKDVWMSGGFMRLAEILREDNPTDAKEYLEKARKIIDANPDLKIRKTQWEKLAQTF